MTTHLVLDNATNRVVSTQILPDQFAPVVMAGQVGVAIQAGQAAAGTITATGGTAAVPLRGDLVWMVWGTFAGAVQLERSFDGGATWLPLSDEAGGLMALSIPGEFQVGETEPGVLYRLNCTALTAGTIAWQAGR